MKVMLSCSEIPKVNELPYPVYMSPKLDGIRALAWEHEPRSRTFTLLPNAWVQRQFKNACLHNLDGELMVLDAQGKVVDFNTVQSAIMSQGGKPNFEFWVFDTITSATFEARINQVRERVAKLNLPWVKVVEQVYVRDAKQAQTLLDKWLAEGYEGAIVKVPSGPYKHGRSTLKQGYSLKLKVFDDTEGAIVDAEPMIRADGEVCEMVGSFIVSWKGVKFSLGTGFTEAQRRRYWREIGNLVGKAVTFTYQGTGPNGKPRFPSFKGIRYERTEVTG